MDAPNHCSWEEERGAETSVEPEVSVSEETEPGAWEAKEPPAPRAESGAESAAQGEQEGLQPSTVGIRVHGTHGWGEGHLRAAAAAAAPEALREPGTVPVPTGKSGNPDKVQGSQQFAESTAHRRGGPGAPLPAALVPPHKA